MIKMTNITASELKNLFAMIIFMGIIGIFAFFYINQPVDQKYAVPQSFQNASSVSSKDASWISNVVPDDGGLGRFLPNGAAELFIISACILIPVIIMNLGTAIRYAKDILTQWV